MKRFAFLLCISIGLISCNRNDENLPSEFFEITAWNLSIDFKIVVIEFKESDKDRIEKLTGRNNQTKFEALNLDSERFATMGQKLRERVRKTLDSELFPCTHLGRTFPWISVLQVEITD